MPLSIQRGIFNFGLAMTVYILMRLTIGGALVALLNNLIPWLAGIGTLLALISLLTRRWSLVLLQLPIMTLFIGVYGDVYSPTPTVVIPDDAMPLTVATYNIRSHSSDVEQITSLILALDADLIGLQELGIDHADYFKSHLNVAYPYQVHYPQASGFGHGLLSRYPLGNSQVLATYQDATHTGVTWIEVLINGHWMNVYIAHLPVPAPLTFSLDSLPRFYDEREHTRQLDTLLEHLQLQADRPTLILCDCNMTDQSRGYARLDDHFAEAFGQVGRGLGFSYTPRPMNIPTIFPRLWRIDYVWHSPDFTALAARVLGTHGTSDHYPLVAELAFVPG